MAIKIDRAFTGRNGIADFARDYPLCPLTHRRCATTISGYIRRSDDGGFEITLGNLGQGQKADTFANYRTLVNENELIALGRKVVRHEVCHARFTDFSVGAEWLARGGNFKLFNLFEDVRIENQERVRVGTGFKWNWKKHVEQGTEKLSPAGVLLAWKYNANAPVSRLYNGPAKSVSGGDWKPVLLAFFRQTQVAKTSRDLIPIMDAFLAEFPDETTYAGSDLVNDTITPKGTPTPVPPGDGGDAADGGSKPQKIDPDDTVGDGTPEDGFDDNGRFEDAALVNRLRQIIASLLLETNNIRLSIGQTGTRPHLPGIIAGEAAFARVGGKTLPPTLTLVCDMSSSMSQAWRRGLQAVAIALATVQGMRASVWISGGGQAVKITPNRLRILQPSHGCETIKLAFEKIATANDFSDLTVVLTDGQIGDGEVDAAAYRARGVRCLAGTLGKVQYLQKFIRQFGRVQLGESPAQLAKDIVREAMRCANPRR